MSVIRGTEAEKELITQNCYGCHSALHLIAKAPASPEGWRPIVEWMLNIDERGRPGSTENDPYRLRISPEHKKRIIEFLAHNITPGIRERYTSEAIVRPTGESARVVFTEWDIPSKVGATSWTDPQGNIWYITSGTEELGPAIGRLDPKTGETQEWHYPAGRSGGFHDIIGDERGNIWVTASGLDKILRFDTRTHQFTAWDSSRDAATYPHTGDFDPEGNFWYTLFGGEESGVAKLNPATGQITHFPATSKYAGAYGLAVDRRRGGVWFTQIKINKVGRIDRSGRLMEYIPPTSNSEPRRIKVDSKGRVWFTQSRAGKIGMLDPETGKITEYDPGIRSGFPYFINIDEFDKVWFDDIQGNMIGKFEPETQQFSLYLLPIPESFARDAFFNYSSDRFTIDYSPANHPVIGRMYVREAEM